MSASTTKPWRDDLPRRVGRTVGAPNDTQRRSGEDHPNIRDPGRYGSTPRLVVIGWLFAAGRRFSPTPSAVRPRRCVRLRDGVRRVDASRHRPAGRLSAYRLPDRQMEPTCESLKAFGAASQREPLIRRRRGRLPAVTDAGARRYRAPISNRSMRPELDIRRRRHRARGRCLPP